MEIKKMISKLIQKVVSGLLFIVAVFGNTGLFSLITTKELKKESLKSSDLVFETRQYIDNPKIPLIERCDPSLYYRSHNEQGVPKEIPQSRQVVFMVSDSGATASASVASLRPVIINFEYITNSNYTIINEIQNLSIDMPELKSFLARNMSEDLKENVDFYSNFTVKSRENQSKTT